MPILRQLPISWPKLNPERGDMFDGKPPERWKIQFQTDDKEYADQLSKEFGFRMTPKEEDGKIQYHASVNKRVYETDPDGNENREKKRQPVKVILANGTPLDPDTIGNGSVANIAFRHFVSRNGNHFRVLDGIQITKHVVRKSENLEFDLTEDLEVVEADPDSDDLF